MRPNRWPIRPLLLICLASLASAGAAVGAERLKDGAADGPAREDATTAPAKTGGPEAVDGAKPDGARAGSPKDAAVPAAKANKNASDEPSQGAASPALAATAMSAAIAAPGAAGVAGSTDSKRHPLDGKGAHKAPSKKPHPYVFLSAKQLEKKLRDDPKILGSISVGRTNAGALVNGVTLQESPRWQIVDRSECYGTSETVNYLTAAIDRVNEDFPEGTPALNIGDISRRSGGPLSPHTSHQSGRDVDVGFYYVGEQQWYQRGNGTNLDLPRTWALVRAFITETDVELIFLDRRLQRLLRAHAEKIGEDKQWLDDIFKGKNSAAGPLIRHERGHSTHLHVRFYNPVAQESGRRTYQALRNLGLIKPPVYYIKHKVRSGQTLGHLARKYRTTVKEIKRANRLRSTLIKAGRTYKIPRHGWVKNVPGVLVMPARRLPPGHGASSDSVTETEPEKTTKSSEDS